MGKARQVLGADRARAAQERVRRRSAAGMSLATIAGYALMLTAPAPQVAAGTLAAATWPAAPPPA